MQNSCEVNVYDYDFKCGDTFVEIGTFDLCLAELVVGRTVWVSGMEAVVKKVWMPDDGADMAIAVRWSAD